MQQLMEPSQASLRGEFLQDVQECRHGEGSGGLGNCCWIGGRVFLSEEWEFYKWPPTLVVIWSDLRSANLYFVVPKFLVREPPLAILKEPPLKTPRRTSQYENKKRWIFWMFFIDISCMTLEGFLQKLRRYLTTCSSGTSLSNPLAILEDISNVTLAMDLLAPVGYLGLLLVRNSVRSVSPRNPRERFFSSLKMHPQKKYPFHFFSWFPVVQGIYPPGN